MRLTLKTEIILETRDRLARWFGEDIAQDVVVKLLEFEGEIDKPSTFAWVLARNCMLDDIKSHDRAVTDRPGDLVIAELRASNPDLTDRVVLKEILQSDDGVEVLRYILSKGKGIKSRQDRFKCWEARERLRAKYGD